MGNRDLLLRLRRLVYLEGVAGELEHRLQLHDLALVVPELHQLLELCCDADLGLLHLVVAVHLL